MEVKRRLGMLTMAGRHATFGVRGAKLPPRGRQMAAGPGLTAHIAAGLTAASVALGLAPVAAAPREFRLCSGEWPPYASAALAGEGASVQLLRAALERAGDRLAVRFLPWDAIWPQVLEGRCEGYLPEYAQFDGERLLSRRIGSGPLGLAERRDQPLDWRRVEDLRAYRLGVVAGYVNTASLDALIAEEALNYNASPDDRSNLTNLARGRIAAAVVDAEVFNYLMRNDPGLAAAAGRLQMNPVLLESKSLHVVAQRRHADVIERIDRALAAVDVDALQADYLRGQVRP